MCHDVPLGSPDHTGLLVITLLTTRLLIVLMSATCECAKQPSDNWELATTLAWWKRRLFPCPVCKLVQGRELRSTGQQPHLSAPLLPGNLRTFISSDGLVLWDSPQAPSAKKTYNQTFVSLAIPSAGELLKGYWHDIRKLDILEYRSVLKTWIWKEEIDNR